MRRPGSHWGPDWGPEPERERMQDVTFPTMNPFVMADFARESVRANPITGYGKLYLPAGARDGVRLPAMVLMEGLGGLKPHRELAYGRDLAADGYAVLVVDTFRARAADGFGDTKRALEVSEAMMLADAYAGLAFLRTHPAVDPARIGVMGFSYGGMISVLAAYDQLRRLIQPAAPGFAAHASFYGCSVPRLDDPRTTGAPVLMLLGDKDRNVSLDRSADIAADLRRGGSAVRKIVYDAWHQWDGNDERRRFVRWSLEHLHVRLDRRHRTRHEETGLPMRGPLTRRLVIALGVRATGYHIQRDADVKRQSYAALLEFLARSMPRGDRLAAE